ncbi:hypothetical protein [Pseudomonas sp. ICMP 561]|uniref:hypothetical protein n=1 Tax=Pseudomonas sp. ICMP 561 TaxID=1718918 RepID=UPI00159BD72E|nr:hypothetical protein [Pseudomonas sp. ICMP 561]
MGGNALKGVDLCPILSRLAEAIGYSRIRCVQLYPQRISFAGNLGVHLNKCCDVLSAEIKHALDFGDLTTKHVGLMYPALQDSAQSFSQLLNSSWASFFRRHNESSLADRRQAVNKLVGQWRCLTFRAGFYIFTVRQNPSTIKEMASRLNANN